MSSAKRQRTDDDTPAELLFLAQTQLPANDKLVGLSSVAASLAARPTTVVDVVGVKPLAALERLRCSLPADPEARLRWRDQAKVAAVMGSCPRSHASFRSGLRSWFEFVELIHGPTRVTCMALPPRLDDVLAWSNTFRCAGTFGNYLGYLRGACHALGYEAPLVGHPAIKRALIAIVKRASFKSRQKMFIGKTFVTNMVAAVPRGLEELSFAMLWLLTYVFLLRLPSEALPTCRGEPVSAMASAQQSVIWRDGDDICLRLLRRKNRPHGSGIFRRGCSCAGGKNTCPVHALWDRFFAKLPVGAQPWADVSPNFARERVRAVLRNLDVPNANLYGTQDFRRGHAEDLRRCGAPLAEILRAGQWKSAAFMSYLDEADLEKDLVFEAAVQSDEELFVD